MCMLLDQRCGRAAWWAMQPCNGPGEARDQATGGKKKKAHVGVDSNLLAARFEEINWGRHDVVTFQEFLCAEAWCVRSRLDPRRSDLRRRDRVRAHLDDEVLTYYNRFDAEHRLVDALAADRLSSFSLLFSSCFAFVCRHVPSAATSDARLRKRPGPSLWRLTLT